jgi:hypothetical protein
MVVSLYRGMMRAKHFPTRERAKGATWGSAVGAQWLRFQESPFTPATDRFGWFRAK